MFQRKIYQLLSGLSGVYCILDDIVIVSESEDEHYKIVNNVLNVLCNAGVTLNQIKCKFFQTEISFVGHIVGKNGIKQDPNKVLAVQNMPAPKDKKALRTFLGMVTYMAKFIPNLHQQHTCCGCF